MNVATNTENIKLLKQEFTVERDKLDDKGQLSICTLLIEITSLNDKVIVDTLGTLDYEKIISSRYQLNFLAKAHLSDVVELRSRSSVNDARAIEIELSVWKKKGKRSALLADGHFVFDTGGIIAKSLSLL
jgi:hypothetical protein